jgi:hypothetical protein
MRLFIAFTVANAAALWVMGRIMVQRVMEVIR